MQSLYGRQPPGSRAGALDVQLRVADTSLAQFGHAGLRVGLYRAGCPAALLNWGNPFLAPRLLRTLNTPAGRPSLGLTVGSSRKATMPRNSTGAIAISMLRRDPELVRVGFADSEFTVLAISPDADDHSSLAELCLRSGWRFLSAQSGRQALNVIRSKRVAVAICERDLPDGNWRVVFDGLGRFPAAPLMIVVSRLADDALWAEVLNVGGYDVLLKPFEPKELTWSVTSAYRQWESKPQPMFCGDPPPSAA